MAIEIAGLDRGRGKQRQVTTTMPAVLDFRATEAPMRAVRTRCPQKALVVSCRIQLAFRPEGLFATRKQGWFAGRPAVRR